MSYMLTNNLYSHMNDTYNMAYHKNSLQITSRQTVSPTYTLKATYHNVNVHLSL